MSGVQTYHLEYTVDGWVNPASPQHSGDELYWNVIGNGWEIPISGVSVQVTGLGAGSALVIGRVRRTGRDRAYLGLTPGLRPTTSQPVASGYRDRRDAVSVQFSPPDGVRPGEIGTLVDEKADPVDVTATMIDLAVRGYLRIEEVPRSRPDKPPKDWTLVRLRDLD